MFAFRVPIVESQKILAEGEKYVRCGAEARIEGEMLYIGTRRRNTHEFFACVEQGLGMQEKTELEHAQGAYDFELDYNLGRLSEERGMPKEELLDEADRQTYSEIMGLPYLAEFEE